MEWKFFWRYETHFLTSVQQRHSIAWKIQWEFVGDPALAQTRSTRDPTNYTKLLCSPTHIHTSLLWTSFQTVNGSWKLHSLYSARLKNRWAGKHQQVSWAYTTANNWLNSRLATNTGAFMAAMKVYPFESYEKFKKETVIMKPNVILQMKLNLHI